MSTSLDGYDTYRLSLTVSGNARSVYSIFGDQDVTLSIPPSYQEDAPFGVNVGGANPAFFPIMAGAEFDSWVTVGITEGDTVGALGSIGLDFESWTADSGLSTSDGAVFWMDPTSAPDGESVIAQVTIPEGTSAVAVVNAQGKSLTDAIDDWRVAGIEFTIG